ncbi:MAG: SMC-Scp complex subunit ScpB [Sediminibacterium sp.]|jgi:segregation and condensation protein B|nr:SMC-Scp complex subunit ScpB [Sediminibacterium sp.]
MEISEIIPHIEVLIFASEKPLTSPDIVELINNTFGFLEERISTDQVDAAVNGIKEKYDSEFYPFEVRESGGGWQFLTKKDYHQTIAQLNGDKFLKRLSNAALETLAIIAYKQPITKGEIESIRGVNTDYSIQKLLEKELILISGRSENMPGKPLLYVTSKTFMDYFGINSPEDLPKIKEVLAEQLIEGTIINPEDFTDQNVANASEFEEESLIIDTETESNEDPIDELAAAEDEALDTEDDGNFSESDNFEASDEDANEDGDDASEADDENSDKDPA